MSVNILLSYAYYSKEDLAAVRRRLVCGRLLIDSGAFTAHTTGKPIQLKEYAEYLDTWRGSWDHAVTLDVIGDPVASKRQTRKLHAMGLPVMPVFTRGDSIEEFDAMVKDVGYVCVGGLVGLPPALVEKRTALLQRRAEEHGGGIHALGVGALPALRRAKPYSADASNISGAFRFGSVVCFTGKQVVSISIRDRKKMLANLDHLRAHGIDVSPLITSGRLPNFAGGRQPLMRAMSLAYAAADEYLKAANNVPAPTTVNDTPGTHLYSSIVGGFLLEPASELDRELHEGFNPRIWAQYGQNHQHHPRRPQAA